MAIGPSWVPSSKKSCACSHQDNQVPYGRQRRIETKPFVGPRERHGIHVILVFGCPQRISRQPVEHAGEQHGWIDRSGCLPSPTLIISHGLADQCPEVTGCRDMRFERGEIVDVPDDGRIVVLASALAGQYPPGKRAELVGRCLDGINAQEGCDLRRLVLSQGDERAERSCDRAIGGSVDAFSDISMRMCGRRPGPVSNTAG